MLKPIYSAIDPSEYLQVAKELSSKTDGASLRSAADRAYYATFLKCRDVLLQKKYSRSYQGLEDHAYVSRVLRAVLGSLGNEENRMRRVRVEVTYEPRDLFGGQNIRRVEWMIATSEEIIKTIENLPVNPDKPVQ
jgi:uncharacterized protein (UPF0332 family)